MTVVTRDSSHRTTLANITPCQVRSFGESRAYSSPGPARHAGRAASVVGGVAEAQVESSRRLLAATSAAQADREQDEAG